MAVAEFEFRPRGLTGAVQRALSSSPIVVLRGARAVGKTSLARELVRNGYASRVAELADDSLRSEVDLDPYAWLSRQRLPVVVDEVQLAPGLLTAAKRLVDTRNRAGSILFTGSAELPPGTLGGLDPLAGRSTTLTLRPMTQREIRGVDVGRSALKELFFGSSLTPFTYRPVTEQQRLQTLQRGGYPMNALNSGRPTPAITGERVHRVIAEDALGRFDRVVAQRVFRDVARLTSNIQNNSSIADALGNIKAETVARYIDRLESVFLLETLPALRGSGRGATKAQPKIHAADSSLALWAAGSPAQPTPELVGAVLESFVVHEIRSDLSFDGDDFDFFYWRDARGQHEVDLVVADSSGRQVAIEVKSARTIRSRDVAGIRAFLEESKSFHRGFIIYNGSELRPVAENIWALPITALWAEQKWKHDEMSTPPPPSTNSAQKLALGPGELTIFFSYSHADDAVWGGAIRKLADDLRAMFESETGETVKMFLDRDIYWGETWRRRIDDELDSATFLVPIVTPTYLRRPECRRELLDFRSKASAGGRLDFVLPIIWTMPKELRGPVGVPEDEVVSILRRTQWQDWSSNKLLEGIPRASQLVLLSGILQSALERAMPDAPVAVESASSTAADEDLTTYLEHIGQVGEDLPLLMEAVSAALADWMGAMNVVPAPPAGSSARASAVWSRKLAEAVAPITPKLDEASADLERAVALVSEAVDRILSASRDSVAVRDTLGDFLAAVASNEVEELNSVEVGQLGAQLETIGAFSKPLRPHILTVRRAIQLLVDLPTLLDGWRRAARTLLDEDS